MRILIELHDIKDPAAYTFKLLERVYEYTQKLEVVICCPRRTKGFIEKQVKLSKLITQVIYLDRLIKKPSKAGVNSLNDVSYDAVVTQINVLSKLGVNSNFSDILERYDSFVEYYNFLFEKIRPDFCMVWNGQIHIDQTAFRNICSDYEIPCVFLERGLFPSSIFYDLEGVNASSSVCNWEEASYNQTKYIKQFSNVEEYIYQNGISIVKIANEHAVKEENPYLLFPLQRDSDSNLTINSPYFKNMYSILKELDSLEKSFDIHFRCHPEDPPNHYTRHLKFSNLKNNSQYKLSEHVERSLGVMTVNSTVGFSSLIKGKKVVCLGNSIFSSKGFTLDYKNFNSFQDLLEHFVNWKVSDYQNNLKKGFVGRVSLENHIGIEGNVFGDPKDLIEKINKKADK